MELIKIVGDIKVYSDTGAILYKAGASVNADGALRAYGPDDAKALDYLANAGSPSDWWGIVTGSDGKPVVQSIYHPAPGYYISTTAQVFPAYANDDPFRYVDSERYPFNVVPGNFGNGCKLGDVGFCYNTVTEDNMFCATADIGPTNHIGEVSILLAQLLALDPSPKKGGTSNKAIAYVSFPGSDPTYKPWPKKCQIAIDTFNKWGGLSKLKELIPQL